MQLILDSESTLDVNTEMTTFDDTVLDEKLINNGVKQNMMNGISNCNKENVRDNVKKNSLQSDTEEAFVEKDDDSQSKPEDTLRDCSIIEQVSECLEQESQEAKSNINSDDQATAKCVDKLETFKESDKTNAEQELSNQEVPILSQGAKSNADNEHELNEKNVDKLEETFKENDEINVNQELSNKKVSISSQKAKSNTDNEDRVTEKCVNKLQAFKENDETNDMQELSNKEVSILCQGVKSNTDNEDQVIEKSVDKLEAFEENNESDVMQELSTMEVPIETITSGGSKSPIILDNTLSEQDVSQEVKSHTDNENKVIEFVDKLKAIKENDESNVIQELSNTEEPIEKITSGVSISPITLDNALSEQGVSLENCNKENEDIIMIESNVKRKEQSGIDLQSSDLSKSDGEIHGKAPLSKIDNDILTNDQVTQEVEAEIQSDKVLDAQNINKKQNIENHAQSFLTSTDSEKEIDIVAIETVKCDIQQSNDVCLQNQEEPVTTAIEEDSIKVIENTSQRSNDLSTNLNQDVIEIINGDSIEEVKTNEFTKEIINVNNIREKENLNVSDEKNIESSPQTQLIDNIKTQKVYCKLSNTLDILSDDDDDELPKAESEKPENVNNVSDKQCINIEDDDDIMVIEEDNGKNCKVETTTENLEKMEVNNECNDNTVINEECNQLSEGFVPVDKDKTESDKRDSSNAAIEDKDCSIEPEVNETPKEQEHQKVEDKSLVSDDIFQSCKKNLADMTRDELEEFCIQKIIEGIVDRSNLSEIKTKLKTMAQNNEEYKKKAMMLTKQIRDLQVVLKSVQEEQKKQSDMPITPLKITRSVGMQVLMTDKPGRRKPLGPGSSVNNNKSKGPNNQASNQPVKPQNKTNNTQQSIPVPRLVLAVPAKTNNTSNQVPNVAKTSSPVPNGVKTPNPPAQRSAEKRTRLSSICVDLTDDEPPTKISARGSPLPPVRLVPSQNLLAPRQQQFSPQSVQNSPRKVYIPISGPQGPVRPGQTIMLRSVTPSGPRPRPAGMNVVRMQSNQIRMPRMQGPSRHPAPLPDAMKQYQPPNWKALPPAPDLKLSKVENGIVISWKIEGYQEDSYEEIASYQLYAYQETTSPPSTALWKKIGDVKALPLPMACTLTQFMAGYKYYFAVRAVDIRSRLGPFSLPGSILLLNKM